MPDYDPLDWELWDHWPELALGMALIAILVAVFWFHRSEFIITVRNRRVSCKGRSPLSHVALAEFLLHDLGLSGPAKILGMRRQGRLYLSFRGCLTKADEQRIRNYLLASR